MTNEAQSFLQAFRGGFSGILRWPQLDALWQRLLERSEDGWYIYAPGEKPPTVPAAPGQLEKFVREIDQLLREEHAEDYCGIVYADDPQRPSFIKVYDPNNLGMVCGSSEHPPLPGWILSTMPPVNLQEALKPTERRRRWWRRLFAG